MALPQAKILKEEIIFNVAVFELVVSSLSLVYSLLLKLSYNAQSTNMKNECQHQHIKLKINKEENHTTIWPIPIITILSTLES